MKTKSFLFAMVTLFVTLFSSFAQSPKDCLGYSIKSEENGKYYVVWDSIAYDSTIYCDSIAYFDQVLSNVVIKEMVIDSFYVELTNFAWEDLSRSNMYNSSLSEHIIFALYRLNKEGEILIYSTTEQKRNQENWPEIEEVTSNIYGSKIGNVIYLRVELISEHLGSGWSGPIIMFCIILCFFILTLKNKIENMKQWIPFDGFTQYVFFLYVSLLLPIAIRAMMRDHVGLKVYGIIFLSVVLFNILLKLIYEFLLERHIKEELKKVKTGPFKVPMK
jgi:hypothetical protein